MPSHFFSPARLADNKLKQAWEKKNINNNSYKLQTLIAPAGFKNFKIHVPTSNSQSDTFSQQSRQGHNIVHNMNWRLPSQKNLIHCSCWQYYTIPIEHQILEHILHYHINDKLSRISFDKAFQGRHNSIPHLSNFPSKKLNLMSVLYEKIFHRSFNFQTQDENPTFFFTNKKFYFKESQSL